MAKTTYVVVKDDIDGTEGAETHLFALDGQEWEIDLSPANLEKLQKSLQVFIDNGSPVKRTTKGVKTFKSHAPSGRSSEQLAAVRAWANANGHSVSNRGRIPESILQEFDEAHKNPVKKVSSGPAPKDIVDKVPAKGKSDLFSAAGA